MSSRTRSSASLTGALRFYRKLLGRKLYILVFLMPLSMVMDGLGITMFMPFLSAISPSAEAATGFEGPLQSVVKQMPLPQSPAAILAIIGLAFLLKGGLRFVTEAFRGLLKAQLALRAKQKLLDGYEGLSYSAFADRNSGHYVNVVTSQTSRLTSSFEWTTQTCMQGAAALIYLVMATLVHWQFACAALLAAGLLMLALQPVTRFLQRLSRKNAEEQSHLHSQIVQVLHAFKYLAATNRIPQLMERVHQSCQRLFGLQARTNLALALSSSVREPLSVLLVLALVVIQIQFFEFALGPIFVTLLLLHRTTQALFAVQGGWQNAMETVGSAEMIMRELDYGSHHREARPKQRLKAFACSIEFEAVSFAYPTGDGDALREVTLSIPRNQTIALVGHSGAGKSTFADLLTLLHRPRTGRILIDGQDALTFDPASWRERIGYVCQETVVFDDTIAANICLDAPAYERDPDCRRRVHEAAKRAFAAEFIDTLPEGYQTVVGDRGVRLSGGQRQRLFIARELYKEPDLLILDEATSALDSASEQAIQKSIEALRGQMTVVVIAHRLATIKSADCIYVLQQGRVVESGPYCDLHADVDSTLRSMIELQSL